MRPARGATETTPKARTDLTSSTWLWGDGSLPSIAKIISDGVSQPKNFRSPMPPMGGSNSLDFRS